MRLARIDVPRSYARQSADHFHLQFVGNRHLSQPGHAALAVSRRNQCAGNKDFAALGFKNNVALRCEIADRIDTDVVRIALDGQKLRFDQLPHLRIKQRFHVAADKVHRPRRGGRHSADNVGSKRVEIVLRCAVPADNRLLGQFAGRFQHHPFAHSRQTDRLHDVHNQQTDGNQSEYRVVFQSLAEGGFECRPLHQLSTLLISPLAKRLFSTNKPVSAYSMCIMVPGRVLRLNLTYW